MSAAEGLSEYDSLLMAARNTADDAERYFLAWGSARRRAAGRPTREQVHAEVTAALRAPLMAVEVDAGRSFHDAKRHVDRLSREIANTVTNAVFRPNPLTAEPAPTPAPVADGEPR